MDKPQTEHTRLHNPTLELLAPAANADTAIQAIMHGADAVYIGPPSHGARKAASNSLDDIARVVEAARPFRARVYATVNTIVHDDELQSVRQLCRDLYHIGVDALIVQDLGLLRLDLPPIALHASTQCDIRTPEKARFLQDIGFSQLVLARELTLREIKEIVSAVDVPVETFVHGALCVSYSGRCHASFAANGRSANRGECSQLCRLPYDLTDSNGRVLAHNRHLLSLRDFNASDLIPDLILAGVSSFKIEGRLKETGYVKNITAHYNRLLNAEIERTGMRRRSSCGHVSLSFTPDPAKSFNRGFTHYFIDNRRPDHIASLLTPKSLGEPVNDIRLLNNGDGISFFDRDGVYTGVNVNRIDGNRIVTARKADIPKGTQLHRTFDVEWQKAMNRETASRKIDLFISMDESGISAHDSRGVSVRLPLDVTRETARNPMDFESEFAKLGNTPYRLAGFSCSLPDDTFIPRSQLSALRRQLVSLLDRANLSTYPLDLRRPELPEARFPFTKIDYRDNVSNALALQLLKDHGVRNDAKGLEALQREARLSEQDKKNLVVMTTRHCVLRELGLCKRLVRGRFAEPLHLSGGTSKWRLHFNCADCEMEVLSEG